MLWRYFPNPGGRSITKAAPANILQYVGEFILPYQSRLSQVEFDPSRREDLDPTIGLHDGRFTGLLIRTIRVQRVLEFGACLGYSILWRGEVLKTTDGRLI